MVTRSCRKGMIRNKQTRKCVPGIGPLRHGLLAKFGYTHVKTLTQSQRHAALEKAIKAYGPLSVFRKLNAIYVYSKRTAPTSSKMFKVDRDWIGATYITHK